MSQVPRVMTVAGSDSGGGAGIQADLKTYQARGVFGTSAISALTAQNTKGVRGVHTVPTQHLSDQMEAVLSDIGADVIKTGMLPTAEVRLSALTLICSMPCRLATYQVAAVFRQLLCSGCCCSCIQCMWSLYKCRRNVLHHYSVVQQKLHAHQALPEVKSQSCCETRRSAKLAEQLAV